MHSLKNKSGARRALTNVRKFYPDVRKVVDADVGAYVVVEPSDVAAAKGKNHKDCPMAKACKRGLHVDGVIVARSTAYLVEGAVATRYRLRSDLREEIRQFDRTGVFDPGAYVLNRPQPSQRMDSKFRRRPGDTTGRYGKYGSANANDGVRSSLRARA